VLTEHDCSAQEKAKPRCKTCKSRTTSIHSLLIQSQCNLGHLGIVKRARAQALSSPRRAHRESCRRQQRRRPEAARSRRGAPNQFFPGFLNLQPESTRKGREIDKHRAAGACGRGVRGVTLVTLPLPASTAQTAAQESEGHSQANNASGICTGHRGVHVEISSPQREYVGGCRRETSRGTQEKQKREEK
jgi:hypothetical protein